MQTKMRCDPENHERRLVAVADRLDAVVIGAGQAGLAAGFYLRQAGLRFTILEAQAQPGGSWPDYYDSLKLFSPRRYSSLPGLAFPGDPKRLSDARRTCRPTALALSFGPPSP